jgi:hypothetical protein
VNKRDEKVSLLLHGQSEFTVFSKSADREHQDSRRDLNPQGPTPKLQGFDFARALKGDLELAAIELCSKTL